jgi:hypothetical protein
MEGPGAVGRRCSVVMRPYERPTLTKAGSFTKVTGLGGRGPRDPIAKHQAL